MSIFSVHSNPVLVALGFGPLDVDAAPEAVVSPKDILRSKSSERSPVFREAHFEMGGDSRPIHSASDGTVYRAARFRDGAISDSRTFSASRSAVRHVLPIGYSLQHFLDDAFFSGQASEYYVGIEDENGRSRLVLYDAERAPYCAGSCDLKVKILGMGKYEFSFCDTEGFLGKLWVPLSPLRWQLGSKKTAYWTQYWIGVSLVRHKPVASPEVPEPCQMLIARICEIGEIFGQAGLFPYLQEAFKLDAIHKHSGEYDSFIDTHEDKVESLDDFIDRLDATYGLDEFTLRFWRNGGVTASPDHTVRKASPESLTVEPEQRVKFTRVFDHIFDVFLWDDALNDWMLLEPHMAEDLEGPEGERLVRVLRSVFSDENGAFFDDPSMQSHIENLVLLAGRVRTTLSLESVEE